MKILLLGPQGSGKGTQGGMLAERFNVPLISTGPLLGDLPSDHPWKTEIETEMNAGRLPANVKVGQILEEELKKEKYKDGFVLDGWGRRKSDLEIFDPGLDVALLIDIPREESVRRLTARRTCTQCGQIFNTVFVPPKVEGVCDACGGKLIQREDDTEAAIKQRLDLYEQETSQTIDYLESRGILVRIDGTGSPEEVSRLVLEGLKEKSLADI